MAIPCAFAREQGEVLKIALVGRFNDLDGNTPSNEWFDTFTKHTLDYYLQELNDTYPHANLELEVFNVHQSAKESDSLYRALAADSSYLLVLDNTWGTELLGARETILDTHIPVLSLNAFKAHKDFGESALFMVNFDRELRCLTAFAKKNLGKTAISVISENDTHLDTLLKEALFLEDLDTDTYITYHGQQHINPSDSTALFKRLEAAFSGPGRDSGRVVLLNVHFMWGNAVLRYLNRTLKDSKFIMWSVPNKSVTDEISNGNTLILNKKSPLVIPEAVFVPYRELKKLYPESFDWVGAPGIMYDLLKVKHLLDFYLSRFVKEPYGRASLLRMFSTSDEKPISHAGNIFRFSKEKQLVSAPVFSEITGKSWEISERQINTDYESIPGVSFGVDLKDVYDINFETTSFKADLEFWILGDTTVVADITKLYRFPNLRNPSESIELISSVRKGGKFYRVYAISGEFHNNFKGRYYPFDTQELNIDIRLTSDRDELQAIIHPKTFEEKLDELSVSGWKSLDYFVTLENTVKEELSGSNYVVESNVIRINYLVKRRYWSSILLIILPLLFIGLITNAILYVRNLGFGNMGEVIVGLFLSITAFSYALAELTPKFDTLTTADLLFLLTFIHVFMVFLYLIAINSTRWGHLIKYKGMVRLTAAILYPLLFIAITLV
jgi:hypothetical protein